MNLVLGTEVRGERVSRAKRTERLQQAAAMGLLHSVAEKNGTDAFPEQNCWTSV